MGGLTLWERLRVGWGRVGRWEWVLLWAVNPEGPEGTRVSAAERENQDTVSSTASRTVLGVGPQTCLRAVCGLASSWRARLPSVRFGLGSYISCPQMHFLVTQLSHTIIARVPRNRAGPALEQAAACGRKCTRSAHVLAASTDRLRCTAFWTLVLATSAWRLVCSEQTGENAARR